MTGSFWPERRKNKETVTTVKEAKQTPLRRLGVWSHISFELESYGLSVFIFFCLFLAQTVDETGKRGIRQSQKKPFRLFFAEKLPSGS
ncbi:MAG: hypothetical protein IKC65_03270 [Lentisphaeria bacterium]|nr:hypothetical protein [Lentisphaeria bacterium]